MYIKLLIKITTFEFSAQFIFITFGKYHKNTMCKISYDLKKLTSMLALFDFPKNHHNANCMGP